MGWRVLEREADQATSGGSIGVWCPVALKVIKAG